MKHRIFFGKGQIRKIFEGVREIFRKLGGNLKQGGNASLPQRGWTPLPIHVCWPNRKLKKPQSYVTNRITS